MTNGTQKEEKRDYDFEPLRGNDDPVPTNAMDGLQLEEEGDDEKDEPELTEDEQNRVGKQLRQELMKARKKISREAKRQIDAAQEKSDETISGLQKRLAALESGKESDELGEKFSSKRAELETKLTEAMEGGNSEEVVRLNGELVDLSADNAVKRDRLERKDEPDELDDLHPDDKDGNKRKPVHKRVKQWMADQKEWWADPDHDEAVAYTQRIDLALHRGGYSVEDDEFYEILNDKLAKKFPDLPLNTGEEEEEELDLDLDDEDEDLDIPKFTPRKNRPSPVNRGDDGAKGHRRRNSKAMTLSAAQVRNMTIFGLDPDNKEHVESYLTEVRATQGARR